jgi:hypothetical protein
MYKISIAIILTLISLTFLALFLMDNTPLTSETIKNIPDKTLTKAICTSQNQCVDVLIECSNGQVTNIKLLSNQITNLNQEWMDFRNNTHLCE